MTDTPGSGAAVSDGRWRTAAVELSALMATAAAGHWAVGTAAGASFGYVLFALVWMPIGAVILTMQRSLRHRIGWTAVAVISVATPLFSHGLPWGVAGRLVVVLAVVTAMTVALRDAGRRVGLSDAIAGLGAVIVWLTWLIAPITMSDMIAERWGDSALAHLLAVHPVLTLNAVDPTAADWTHRAIAYRWLTRLGQDLPMEWPDSNVGCLAVHVGVLTVAAGISRVRRGNMFHVEHS